jgi:hypothetical protein
MLSQTSVSAGDVALIPDRDGIVVDVAFHQKLSSQAHRRELAAPETAATVSLPPGYLGGRDQLR